MSTAVEQHHKDIIHNRYIRLVGQELLFVVSGYFVQGISVTAGPLFYYF
jgi:hypothetical protein